MASFHPAYILRLTGGEVNAVKRLVWDDLKAVRTRLDETAAAAAARRAAGTVRCRDTRISRERSLARRTHAARGVRRDGRLPARVRRCVRTGSGSSTAPRPKSWSTNSGRSSVLPVQTRERLQSDGFALEAVEPVVVQRSSDGQTTKGLFRLHDGSEVEAVLMEHHGDRTTVCISSQAGCAFKCAFCATGQAGFTRNLAATEIFDQARFFARELKRRDKKITNIVFMGHGRTLPQLWRGDGRRAPAQRSARLRPGASAHHDLDRRARPADRALRGRGAASQSRDLAARADRRAPLGASCPSTAAIRSRS